MNWIPGIFRRRELFDALSEEMRLHIEERAEHLMGEGMSPEEAAREARKAFGNRTLLEERSREVWQWPTVESLWTDMRFALRQLRHSPGFALAAIVTLALAIGANAVVFSVMNAFVIQPLNVARAGSLYTLQHGSDTGSQQSYPDYVDLRDRNHTFDSVVAYNISQAGLDTGQNPSSVWVIAASGNYFDALGLKPTVGRLFHAEDEHGPNSAPYVVLTFAFWHTHFHDDRGIVGRVVRLDGHPFTVLGVGPKDFHGTLLFFNPDVIVPLMEDPMLAGGGDDMNARGERWIFEVMGYLKPGITPARAVADLNSIGAYLEKTYPKDEAKTTFVLTRPSLYGDSLGKPVKAFMVGLMLLTGLILLAACANLGSLFAARAADRSKEVALRLALGSTRKRILRGLLTEAMIISVAGGGIGLLGSVALLRALSTWQPFPEWPLHLAVNPDAKVYAVAVGLALLSGMLFGAVPVRQVLRSSPYEVVKAGAGTSARKRFNAREILLVVQIAICGVLVTSSLVAVRGLVRSLDARFGFAKNTMVAQTDLSMAGYSPERVPAMQKRMIEAMQALPGVETAAMADSLPLGTGSNEAIVFKDTTADLRPANAAADAAMFNVSPEYFRTAGTELLAGREFTWHDDEKSPRVAVVNVEFARQVFGSPGNAMGHMFKKKDGTRVEVVGVAEDGKYNSLTENPTPALFLPIQQSPTTSSILVVRAKAGPEILAPAMRSALRQLDAGLPVLVETRDKPMEVMMFGPKMATMSLGVLGVMGAMLSITGIFGMAAYSVSKRLKELGIRVALGAQRKEVLQAALGRAFKLLAVGSAAGLVLGLLATKVLAFIVYQASPRDPLVLAGVVLGMALLGLVATWIPAQRALSVNPLVLLREE
jgi:predicted permease